MRIAVLSTLPAIGGAGSAAWRLTRALADFGHECSFFILEGPGNSLHIPLIDKDNTPLLPALFRHWSDLTTPEALTANAVELFSDAVTSLNISLPLPEAIHKAEVIHLHWVAGMLFSPALLQAIAGKKVVWTLHDANAFTGGCHYTGACRAFKSHCCNCPLLKKRGANDISARSFHLKEQTYPFINPFIVTPSAWLGKEVKAGALLGKYPVSTIPNPINTESFHPPRDISALRRKLNLPEDAFIILSGCEHLHNPRKNTKALFEALELLSPKAPDLPLTVLLYGYGQSPKCAFPVHHFGYVDNETVMAELYGAADIFIHTSLQDNLPLSLCEAQLCGTPTLCFAIGGCPETMLPGKTGFLVAEITSQALAESLGLIIATRNKLPDMREAARAFAVERFAPNAAAAAYTEVFAKTQAASGLMPDNPLYTVLLQNQITTLKLLKKNNVHIYLNNINLRIGRILPRFMMRYLKKIYIWIRAFVANLRSS